ncbi:DUF294 nucleotidyltransferase-like domain-containing protein [Salinicola avicenniae]|uniref:DUF294 nucleotidyltransferase-like domain-containing protein n=1 Tax=Salinicola avicenniae TaxID=2916836 RepID=UPI002072C0C2|nr:MULTISPECIES: DUF294 nucleotidyltransferase-like domain-containing protein [unclassified Salinicola]
MLTADLNRLPFTLLDSGQRRRLEAGLDLGYYAVGQVLLESGAEPENVYLIHKGEVVEEDPALSGEAAWIGHYAAGDLFGAISVLNGRSRYRFRVEQEALCHLLPAALFLSLCEGCPAFAEYFQQRLADKTQRLLARRGAFGATLAGFMLSRVRACLRPPLVLAEAVRVTDAAAALRERRADSLLVGAGEALGMVTKTDLLEALVHARVTPQSPLTGLGTRPLIGVDIDDYLFSALVTMTQHRVARLVVFENGGVAGIVELLDVLGQFSSRTHVVGLQIEQAQDMAALVAAGSGLTALVEGLMAQGVKLRFVMALLSALNARLIQKAFTFAVPETLQAQSCLLVLGSEGRGEQVLKTDQDNALILADGESWAGREAADRLTAAMQHFSDQLAQLGYPPCPGGIMVSNPAWVASESAWLGKIARWASSRDAESLMQLAILLDARAVGGQVALLDALRESLFRHCADDELLLSHFARGALRFGSPLRLFSGLRRREEEVDVKKAGIFPIVHGVRTMALERRVTVTSTFDRLEALVVDGRLDRAFADDLAEALGFFAELRLRRQLAAIDTGASPAAATASVIVSRLSGFERDLLRESLHTVRAFKQRLTHRYHLEY